MWTAAIRNAEDGTVYKGDKSLGKDTYKEFNDTYVPDIIRVTEAPELGEIKNFSPYVTKSTGHLKPTTLNGHLYPFGNTSERLKMKVLGTRARGRSCDGTFDHATGSGFVAAHGGDYRDAIKNKKALVRLLVHEAGFGMAPFAARYLRYLGRQAKVNGHDATDYGRCHNTRAFVPYYAQRLSTASALGSAVGIKKGIDAKLRTRARSRLVPSRSSAA